MKWGLFWHTVLEEIIQIRDELIPKGMDVLGIKAGFHQLPANLHTRHMFYLCFFYKFGNLQKNGNALHKMLTASPQVYPKKQSFVWLFKKNIELFIVKYVDFFEK